MSYVDPDADFGSGEVKIKSVDPLEVFIDPASKDPFCRDASNIIVAKVVSEDVLIKAYPDYAEMIQECQETSYINIPTESRYGKESQQVTLKRSHTGQSITGEVIRAWNATASVYAIL